MRLAGLQKLTLLDYPGEVACTVFTQGCNLRCPFCQNPGLVLPELFDESEGITEEEFFDFLGRRRGRLSAVAITGGEPTLHRDLPDFLAKIRQMGYLVKLDTNGLNPEVLSKILETSLVNYVAMDVKNSPGKYALTCGVKEEETVKDSPSGDTIMDTISSGNDTADGSSARLWKRAARSIALLKKASIDCEFRTTVVTGLHTVEDIREIAGILAGPRPWYLQQFREGVEGGSLVGTVSHCGLEMTTPSRKVLEEMKAAAQELVPNVSIRGI